MKPPFECPRQDDPCGHLHAKCIGHSRRTGLPCNGDPMRGTADPPRCRHHLGKRAAVVMAEYESNQRAVALLRQQQQAARAAGLTGDLLDPLGALHQLTDEAWRWKQACQALVGELTELRYRSASGEALRSEVALYERSIERVGKLLVDITRLGIEDRMAKVAARQIGLVQAAIEAALVELAPVLGFDPDDDRIRPVIARHLREVER